MPRVMMKRQDGKGAPVKLIVFPEAYHAFDSPTPVYGIRYFGHWLRYNADADCARSGQDARFSGGGNWPL